MLDKMAFFVYVVRLSSISAAARKFSISVSAGSRWLQDLEQHLGVPLYRRSNRLLTPTPAGQKLFNDFSPLVDQSESLERQLQGFQSHQKGHIEIACTPVYANHYLMPIVSEYLVDHPHVTFNLNITPWALDHAADVDFSVSANASYQGYREKDLLLVRRELMSDPFVVVTSPAYLGKHATPEAPAELKNHLCLFATTLTGSNDWVFTRDGETQIIKIPKSLEVNDSDLLLQGVRNGAGIAYLPEFMVREPIAKGELNKLMSDFESSIWSLNLYYQPAGKASAVASHFKEFWLQQHNVLSSS